jgi:hypothetical protein
VLHIFIHQVLHNFPLNTILRLLHKVKVACAPSTGLKSS